MKKKRKSPRRIRKINRRTKIKRKKGGMEGAAPRVVRESRDQWSFWDIIKLLLSAYLVIILLKERKIPEYRTYSLSLSSDIKELYSLGIGVVKSEGVDLLDNTDLIFSALHPDTDKGWRQGEDVLAAGFKLTMSDDKNISSYDIWPSQYYQDEESLLSIGMKTGEHITSWLEKYPSFEEQEEFSQLIVSGIGKPFQTGISSIWNEKVQGGLQNIMNTLLPVVRNLSSVSPIPHIIPDSIYLSLDHQPLLGSVLALFNSLEYGGAAFHQDVNFYFGRMLGPIAHRPGQYDYRIFISSRDYEQEMTKFARIINGIIPSMKTLRQGITERTVDLTLYDTESPITEVIDFEDDEDLIAVVIDQSRIWHAAPDLLGSTRTLSSAFSKILSGEISLKPRSIIQLSIRYEVTEGTSSVPALASEEGGMRSSILAELGSDPFGPVREKGSKKDRKASMKKKRKKKKNKKKKKK